MIVVIVGIDVQKVVDGRVVVGGVVVGRAVVGEVSGTVVVPGTVVTVGRVVTGGTVVAGAVGGLVGLGVVRGEVTTGAFVVDELSSVVGVVSTVVVGKPAGRLVAPMVEDVDGPAAGGFGVDLGNPAIAMPTAALHTTTIAMR